MYHIHCKAASFYLLPKIHKPGNTGRPITTGNGSPTEKITLFVDHFIKPLVPHINSYIHDSPNFLRKLEDIKNQIPSTAIIGTFDVTSLYTYIPHAEDAWKNTLLPGAIVPEGCVKPFRESAPFPDHLLAVKDKREDCDNKLPWLLLSTQTSPLQKSPLTTTTFSSLQIDSNGPSLKTHHRMKTFTQPRRPSCMYVLMFPILTFNPTPMQHGTFKCDLTSRCIVCSQPHC
ncbi:hypothetical protein BSL78_09424 [Apostichopus japonicus]|uniref:Reverse transcriptase domain-containing protein n=1 Tax=Stichopus japonicus TaxID=307972 RepID=A0A2G8L079_STIJA|nr:hypothetical protein BSL78_09424 [Apostichopus japonicus]